MTHIMLVALGGAIGATARHLVNLTMLRLTGPGFPWGTFVVNVAGAFVMGILVGWLARRSGTSYELRLFLATGCLGGFTTFSAFSLDFLVLWRDGAHLPAAAYAFSSVIMSLLAVFGGLALVRTVS